jgi:hypothetical protein
MTINKDEAAPVRGRADDIQTAFLGEWHAEGTSYGGTKESGADP